MAPKGDHHHLLKVGAEAFGLLEESRYPPPPPQGPQQEVPPKKEAALNCFEAAKKYGGIVVVDPRKRKPAQVPKGLIDALKGEREEQEMVSKDTLLFIPNSWTLLVMAPQKQSLSLPSGIWEMAPKGDHLLKVGREGFAMVDEFLGPRRVPPPPAPQGLQQQRQFPPQHVYSRPVSPPKEAVLNSLEAAEMYGGMVFVDYRKRKPTPLRKVYY